MPNLLALDVEQGSQKKNVTGEVVIAVWCTRVSASNDTLTQQLMATLALRKVVNVFLLFFFELGFITWKNNVLYSYAIRNKRVELTRCHFSARSWWVDFNTKVAQSSALPLSRRTIAVTV